MFSNSGTLAKVAIIYKYCSSSNFAQIVYLLWVSIYSIKVVKKYLIVWSLYALCDKCYAVINYLIHTVTLWSILYYNPIFKRENGGTGKLSNTIKITQLFSGGARIYIPGRPTVELLNSDGFGFVNPKAYTIGGPSLRKIIQKLSVQNC